MIKLIFHLILLVSLRIDSIAPIASQLAFTSINNEVQIGFGTDSTTGDFPPSTSSWDDGVAWPENLSTSDQQSELPGCDDLEVTQMDFIGTDSLIISIYNHCEDCLQHVYTGLEVYNSDDMLVAESIIPQSEQTPDNNAEKTYFLNILHPFDFQGINQVKMTQDICDSLTIKDLVSNENVSIQVETDISIAPNPSSNFISVLNPASEKILYLKIFDNKGRIVRTITSNFHQIDISDLSKGIYFIVFQSENGLLRKKLVKE